MVRRYATLVAAVGLILACDLWNGGGSPAPQAFKDPGMVLIPAAGKTFRMGSTGSSVNPEEAPALEVGFSYDFFMDSTEVTQEAFSRAMERNPVPAKSPFGQGPAYPVHQVSWFDAVLFCNARSKAAGLDTVYVYSRLDRASEGGVYSLADFEVRLDRRGYRLPTEAEWEFAARAGSKGDFPWGGLEDSLLAGKHAWYSANAKGSTHPVAGLDANAFGLYDMSGNVMEWVNDWKGMYPGTPALDFAGARDPGPQNDAPVKGGAFKFGLRELRPAGRSATYATIRSARSEYVGFRCVLAAIAHPVFSASDGQWAGTDAVRLDISRIRNLIGGRDARLVFVNATPLRRHLVSVDYAESPPRLREFGDIENVFHPSISPDGRWVAFGTAAEGSETGSTLHVRPLGPGASPDRELGPGFIPRWWVDPVTRDTFLVYATSASDNSQGQWSASRTLRQRMSGGEPVGSPETLVSDGGFHDGLSRDGRWLATGFRLLKARDNRSGTVKTLFTAPENGKGEGDTSQVCNVSIAPDFSGRMLFLDFGYDLVSRLTGSFYDIHQIAFMADPEGKILHWYPAPREERGWDDLEWTNHSGYAVAAATAASGAHGHLYLLNLENSGITRLASGTLLATPSLWLGNAPTRIDTSGLALDSLGHYNDPATESYQTDFAGKMRLFWKRHANLEVIFTGSSHVSAGIDANQITRLQALSMGYPTNGWLGQEEWVDGYVLNHCPKLKVVVMEAFPGWMHLPSGDFTWTKPVSRTKGVAYDRSHGFWKDGLPFGFEELVRQASVPDNWDSTGFFHQDSVNWGGAPTKPTDAEWDANDPEYNRTMERMEAFARKVAERRIHLVLVNFPTNPAYAGNAYYGPYGPRLEVAKVIISRLKAMEGISPYVHFYDAHLFNRHDYSDAEAVNAGHLSSSGAAKLTKRLDSLINSLP